jgi:cytochrome c oxidase subunit 3
MSVEADRIEQAALREPFDDIGRQRFAALAGIWMFSASEILFFGGIFMAYAVNFYRFPAGFQAAGAETDLRYGLINTVVLLCSSAVVAVAAKSARWRSLGSFSRACLWVAALLGLVFLVTKGLEYHHDIEEGLVPGRGFIGSPGFPIPVPGSEIFFGFYWAATALHAVHLTVGIALLARLAVAGRSDPDWYAATPAVNVTALYWGLVDVIWTVVFVLIYLPGRAT